MLIGGYEKVVVMPIHRDSEISHVLRVELFLGFLLEV